MGILLFIGWVKKLSSDSHIQPPQYQNFVIKMAAQGYKASSLTSEKTDGLLQVVVTEFNVLTMVIGLRNVDFVLCLMSRTAMRAGIARISKAIAQEARFKPPSISCEAEVKNL